MVNPYASEDFNRIRVNPRDRAKEDQSIPHPLMEGKKMDITPNELKAFTKAMEKDEFKSMLNEYVGEISDPKHRPELDQYLTEMEERGEVPPGVALIQPTAGFCIKTSGKRLVSDHKKTFFDQKTFVNICYHEVLEIPQQESMTQPNGTKGTSWSLPYRVSKGKPDQDAKGTLCMTYDVVFHPDVAKFCQYAEFKKFVADTAIDGVNRVVAENKEKVSTDYKILKHINCKGERPNKMLVKTAQTQKNELLKNIDLSKQETKLQKEVEGMVKGHKKELEEAQNAEKERVEALKAAQAVIEQEEELSEKSDDEKPAGIIQPKFKVVHSYPVEIGDTWQGHKDSVEGQDLKSIHKLPTEITVTIFVKFIDSMKLATLDINETTLVFSYPNVYYLDVNLMYKVDKGAGSAKFDKSRKTLTIRVPVVGSTDDSQRVLDQHYRAYKEGLAQRNEQLKNLQQSKLEEKQEAKRKAKLMGKEIAPEAVENDENVDESNSMNQAVREFEEQAYGASGFSKPKVIQMDSDVINDKYNVQSEVDKSKIMAEDKEATKKDDFLKIYKEDKKKKPESENAVETNIRFKQTENDQDSGFKLNTSAQPDRKPLITVIESGPAITDAPKKIQELEVPFTWTDAQRAELKPQFIAQADFVFLNINLKGYNKDEDVRYALSSDELLIEIRDRSAHKGVSRIRRLCQTLTKQIDVPLSEVQLLVDFVCVKLCKLERGLVWNGIGYDIADFTIPERGQMKSNFLKVKAKPVVEPTKQEAVAYQEKTEVEKEFLRVNGFAGVLAPKVEEIILTEEEKAEQKEAEIKRIIEKQVSAQQTYLNLSTDSIYQIY